METAAATCFLPERNGAGGEGRDAPKEMDGARGVVSVGPKEIDGARGVESVATERDGVRGVESIGKERDGARGVEGVATKSNGAGAAAPQIQKPKKESKTCHQCRQFKKHFKAVCKKVKKKDTLCTMTYCQKCLLNRYGEVADEVVQQEGWTCPKCRGECNCSQCRRNNGEEPTGILAHAAKASGCSSVQDLLNKGPDMVAAAQKLVNPLKVNGTSKGNLKRALEADDGADELPAQGNDVNAISSVPAKKKLKVKKKKVNCTVNNSTADEKSLLITESPDALEIEIVLPKGTPVTNIAGAELEAEDVGPALQFYEFCHTFAEVFEIRKGQPEKILQDITGRRELRVVSSLIAELHINMLSVIKKDRGEKPLNYSKDGDEWIMDIGKYISQSTFISKELPADSLNQGVSGYKNLSSSCKLHLLNFLCDETLSCAKLRNWIDKQNEKVAERKSAAREKIRAASEKEKKLKERQNDMAKAMLLVGEGETSSIEETNNIILQIKEAKQVKQAAVDDLNTLEDEAGGTKPVIVNEGAAYWKLDGYCNGTTIVRQEFDNENIMGIKDMWFMFTEDEERVIEDYLATRTGHRSRNHTRLK